MIGLRRARGWRWSTRSLKKQGCPRDQPATSRINKRSRDLSPRARRTSLKPPQRPSKMLPLPSSRKRKLSKKSQSQWLSLPKLPPNSQLSRKNSNRKSQLSLSPKQLRREMLRLTRSSYLRIRNGRSSSHRWRLKKKIRKSLPRKKIKRQSLSNQRLVSILQGPNHRLKSLKSPPRLKYLGRACLFLLTRPLLRKKLPQKRNLY
jgi:hypothetical protein